MRQNLREEERKAGGLDWSYVTTNLNTPGKSAHFEKSHSFIRSLQIIRFKKAKRANGIIETFYDLLLETTTLYYFWKLK